MAKSNPSTVLLSGSPEFEERPLEALDACGNGFITPGMLVEYYGDNVRPHSTAAGAADSLFAHEGLNIDANSKTLGDIDTDYDTDGMAVKIGKHKKGDRVYALVAPLQNISQNALMESNGDGYIKAGTTKPVCRALEAVDNSGSTDPARIRVVVI